jgi:hypothetical protein
MTRLVPLIALLGSPFLSPFLAGRSVPAEDPPFRVHSITDISHEFTFYLDGRFGKNYVLPDGGADARNWATLHECDLSPANLLVLASGATPCPYLPEDIALVRAFLEEGGGVLVLGDFGTFRDEKDYRLNEIARAFGAEFAEEAAKEPLRADPDLRAEDVRTYGGKTVRLERPEDWKILLRDADGRVVLARRSVGKGSLALGSRALAGQKPDATDPINEAWWRPLLRDLARGKPVDPRRPPQGKMPEREVERDGLRIRYSEYLEATADEIFAIYARSRPALERILGVPPAPDMLTSLILLPTGGGGFSSGREIGLGIWWGGFPKERYGMVELLGHEATHSWVLPFAEPLWNEGIATYVGIALGRELGHREEADATLRRWIEGARRHDPDLTRMDLAAEEGIPHEVRMAKPMWIFEELRKETPDILARYFRAKRTLIDPKTARRYGAEDSVAVLSQAAGRDLFPWFRSLGVRLERSRTAVPVP